MKSIKYLCLLGIFCLFTVIYSNYKSNFHQKSDIFPTPTPAPTPTTIHLNPNDYCSNKIIAPKTGYVANISYLCDSTKTDAINILITSNGDQRISDYRTQFPYLTYAFQYTWSTDGTTFVFFDGQTIRFINFHPDFNKLYGYFTKAQITNIDIGKTQAINMTFSSQNNDFYYNLQDGPQIYKVDRNGHQSVIKTDYPVNSLFNIQHRDGIAYVSDVDHGRRFQVVAHTPQIIKKYIVSPKYFDDGVGNAIFSSNLQYFCLNTYYSASGRGLIYNGDTLLPDNINNNIRSCGIWVNPEVIIVHNYDGNEEMYSYSQRRFLKK